MVGQQKKRLNGETTLAAVENGTVTMDIDGQNYKFTYSIGSQFLDRVFALSKPLCKLSKQLVRAFISESRRVSRNKNLN